MCQKSPSADELDESSFAEESHDASDQLNVSAEAASTNRPPIGKPILKTPENLD
jgi:hypothetical protein